MPARCPTCHRLMDPPPAEQPPADALSPHDARALARMRFALGRWALGYPRAMEQAAAAAAVGNGSLGAACAAYALGVIDGAYAKRKAGHHPRYTQSGTRSQRWAHRGALLANPSGGPAVRIEALGPEYAPRAGDTAQPGDIITVGPNGAKPAHTTLVIARDFDGVWCVGFNQSGVKANGARASGELTLTFYPFAAGRGFSVHKVTSVPLDAYDGGPTHTIEAEAVARGVAAFERMAGVSVVWPGGVAA